MLLRKTLTAARLTTPAATKPSQAGRLSPAPASSVDDEVDALAASPSPRLLKPEEVAAMLGVSERTLERWRMTGDGPGFVSLTRKTVRYTIQAVAEFVQARVKRNTAG